MEKGKGKGRWKEDSLRNVGRTDARTDTKVILYSVQCMHCIGQTIKLITKKTIQKALNAKSMMLPNFRQQKLKESMLERKAYKLGGLYVLELEHNAYFLD